MAGSSKSSKIVESLLKRSPLDVVLAAGCSPATWAAGFIQPLPALRRRVPSRQSGSSNPSARSDQTRRPGAVKRKAA